MPDMKRADQIEQLKCPAVLADAPIGFFTSTPDGRLLSANQTLVGMCGYNTPSQMLSSIDDLSLQVYADPADRERFKQLMETHGAVVNYEHRLLRRDGTEFWASNTARVVGADAECGRAVYFQGFLSDITERKRTEEALKESHNKYRKEQEFNQMLLDTSPSFIVAIGSDGKILMMNQAFLDVVEYTSEEIIGKDYTTTFIPAEDQAAVVEIFRQIFAERKATFNENRVKSKSGQIHRVQWHGRAVGGGEVGPNILVGVGTDITKCKQAEEAMRESERKLKVLLSNLPGIAYRCRNDADWTMEFVSMGCHSLTGYHSDDIVGNNKTSYLDLIHPQDQPMVWNDIQDALNRRKPYKLRYRITSASGEKKWVFEQGQGVHWENGRATIIEGFICDITDQIKAEADRERLQAQLIQAQKLESVGRLAGGVAHDFNNMLSVILGYAEMGVDSTTPDNPLHDDFKMILDAGRRSADITRQLLTFARKQTISPQRLLLNDGVENMLKMLRRLVGEHIGVSWKPSPHLWPVMMDPSQLDQILANLCVNARDAIGDVGKVTIETVNIYADESYCSGHALFVPGEYAMLAVSDDGHGMDKKTLDQIFEPFFTTKAMGDGTGLGLPTVYGIVKQHNGFINVYSEPGQGTTFKIYLPHHEGEQSKNHTYAHAELLHGKDETVLVVEDETETLTLTKKMLESMSYSVLGANTPSKALELAQVHGKNIDLLMLDVVMPEMSGRTLAQNLRGLYPNIKILFMSGYTSNVIAHHGVLGKGVPFLQKPFSKRELALQVRPVLDAQRVPLP